MPNGKIHALSTTLLAGFSGPALVMLAGQPLLHAGAFVGGCMAGLLINPDLDVDHGSRSWEIVRRSAGYLAVALWQLFWWPYARLIPHRSPLSHFPVIGTLLRLGYLLIVPGLLWLGVSVYAPALQISLPALSPAWGWALAGLMVSDALHALLDVSWP